MSKNNIKDYLKVNFNKDEYKQLPLTVKTAKKMPPITFDPKDKDKRSFVSSKLHRTSRYSSFFFYKPISLIFYEEK